MGALAIAARLAAGGFGWALKHETLVGWGFIAAGAITLAGYGHHEHAVALRKATELRAARVQGQVDQAAAAPVARAQARTVLIQARAERAAAAVEHAPGADAPVPPDVLAQWAAGVDAQRNDTGEGK